MSLAAQVRIPRDPEARARLANFAGLTDEDQPLAALSDPTKETN